MTNGPPTATTVDAAAPAALHKSKGGGPLRGLYNWVLKLAAGKHAEPALFVVSFAESSFFPLPPDVMLAPMALTRPDRAWRYALVCTMGSVLGALLGYAIGYLLFESVGSAIISFFGYAGIQKGIVLSVSDPYDEAEVDALDAIIPAFGVGLLFKVGPNWMTRVDLGFDQINVGLVLRF